MKSPAAAQTTEVFRQRWLEMGADAILYGAVTMAMFAQGRLKEPLPEKDIIVTDAHPYRYNRVIPFSYFNRTGHTQYALGETAGREAVLLFNTHTELTEEKTIEYII